MPLSLLQVAYCVDMDKSVIIGNMEKRGWVPVGPDDDWQVYWASTQTCRQARQNVILILSRISIQPACRLANLPDVFC